MSDVRVSVIMPVYKVEDYVARAMESVLAQTFIDFEFLIVDDGSPDGSGAICDAYAGKDPRIRVIHTENRGAPCARNLAMDQAKGVYTYFLDSDDWLEPDMFETMVALAEKYQARLVITGFYIDTYYSGDRHVTDTLSCPDAFYETAAAFREAAYELFDRNLLYTPWNKLYRTDWLKGQGIRFPQTFWDDFPFVLDVVRDIDRVAVCERAFYHFIRARAESETARYRENMYEKREEEHGWLLDLYRHWGGVTPEADEMIQRRYAERLLGCVENLTNRACTLSRREKRRRIKEMISTPRARYAVKTARPRTLLMRTLLLPVKWRWAGLCYLEGRYISGVKAGNVKRFATLKARR